MDWRPVPRYWRNLQKNNNKKAYQLVKELTSLKQGRTTTIQSREMSHRRTRHPEEVDRVLFRIVYTHNNRRSQGARCPSTNQQWQLPYPAGRSWSCSKITEERQVGRSGQHSIGAGPRRRRGHDRKLCYSSSAIRSGRQDSGQHLGLSSLVITLPKKGNLQLCQNYRTISLISHPNKAMLRILLNRLKPQAEEIIKEKQAGLRAGRSTTEQIFHLRIPCEKYLQHQQSLYHVFVDFKKAFDRVWHAALWATIRLHSINDNLIRTTECLYNKATSAVYHDNNIGEWFRTTIGVRQACLLSTTLFNIFLERIMAGALEDHEGTISIGGWTITYLRFADDIDGLAGQKQELIKLVNHLEEASTAYGMQISAHKTQLMINSIKDISTDITIDSKKLETVRSFKYLGAIVSDEGSKPEVLSRIAQTTAAVTKLKVIWNDKNIAISSKIRLMRSLAMSIFLYACETWTITADIERKIQALEMRCFRKLLGISYRDHITNEEVNAKIGNAIGPYEDL